MAANNESKYKRGYAERVYKLALLGLTEAQIGEVFGASPTSVARWTKKYPEFRDAIMQGKTEADANVAAALYMRATGYKHKVTKHAQSEGKFTDTIEHEELVPPDTTAALRWLQARQPDKWREKQELELSGNTGITVQFDIPRPKTPKLTGLELEGLEDDSDTD